jgi:hypothetical protein
LTGITEKAASLLDELIDYPIDHGPSHLFRVEEIVLDLVEVLMSRPASDGQYEITPLNNHECLMLLAAIQLHGIGLSLAARSNIRDMSKKHVGRITENAILGEGNWKDLNLGIPYDYREGIALVSTGGCSVGVLGSTYTSRCIAYNTNIRSSLLAALLRVADALDASQVRIKTSAADIASNLHLNWQGLLPYEYVSGIGYANKRVKFSFRLPRDDFDSYTEVLPDAILDFHQKRWGVLSRALSVYEVNIVLPMDKNDHKVIKSRAKKIPANLFDKIRLEGIENEEGPL